MVRVVEENKSDINSLMIRSSTLGHYAEQLAEYCKTNKNPSVSDINRMFENISIAYKNVNKTIENINK